MKILHQENLFTAGRMESKGVIVLVVLRFNYFFKNDV